MRNMFGYLAYLLVGVVSGIISWVVTGGIGYLTDSMEFLMLSILFINLLNWLYKNGKESSDDKR